MNDIAAVCPCGSAKEYQICCGPYINKSISMPLVPQTAEKLMRSRYTAYVIHNEKYLSESWHHTTRPINISAGQEPVKWVDLTIINTIDGKPGDSEGVVEFIARYKANGKMMKLHEISCFIKENGRWFYLDAAH
ncbi:MAG: hypothetical protein GXP19_03160 [Gammaproteobacteria bacterium]|nr:hypothetical protein [Gammaproteobacteria bacterium]